MLTGDPQQDYPIWRRLVFESIRKHIGREAGAPQDDQGDYENVVFQIDLTDNLGTARITIGTIRTIPPRRKALMLNEWYSHSGDPEKVALAAIDAFQALLRK